MILFDFLYKYIASRICLIILNLSRILTMYKKLLYALTENKITSYFNSTKLITIKNHFVTAILILKFIMLYLVVYYKKNVRYPIKDISIATLEHLGLNITFSKNWSAQSPSC